MKRTVSMKAARSFAPYIAVLALLYVGIPCFAQEKNRSSVLFILDIAPEARSSGMGDVGAATSPDAVSQRWNAAKYIFSKQSHGASLSYTPWLSKIIKGMNMGFLSGYMCFDNNNNAIGVSALYLSTGDIDLYTSDGTPGGKVMSGEYAMDVSYSRRLGKHLSGGITLRYASGIKVEPVGSTGVLRPAPAFAGDVAFFYTKPMESFGKETNLSFGTCISNLGTKVKLSGDREIFLPMNWRLGATYDIIFDKNNALSASFDINKSLVPLYYEKNLTIFDAIGKSFDQGRDFSWAAGVEYSFAKSAMLRTGYHHSKNNRGFKYFTLGAGLVYQSFRFDGSYLITTANISSPLSNTFRISLSYLW